ncbi:hypothetical protein [Alloscardovia omnicolens]|uniref:hypothetical protein n=1 Tax=Alloscardovia omnicolens TaxID=419015 RepID=UPI003A7A92A4
MSLEVLQTIAEILGAIASIAGAVLAVYALKSANEANKIASQALMNDYESALEKSASKVKPPYWVKRNDTNEWGVVLIVDDGVIHSVEIVAECLQDELHFNAESLPQGIIFFPNKRNGKPVPQLVDSATFSANFESLTNSRKHKIVSLTYTNPNGRMYEWTQSGYRQVE